MQPIDQEEGGFWEAGGSTQRKHRNIWSLYLGMGGMEQSPARLNAAFLPFQPWKQEGKPQTRQRPLVGWGPGGEQRRPPGLCLGLPTWLAKGPALLIITTQGG